MFARTRIHVAVHMAVSGLVVSGMVPMVPVAYAADGAALEEVIVTAQKRKENLQDIPISVQALDARALEKAGIVSLSDIRASVPGLTVDTYPGSSELLYPSIRGIVPNSVQTSVPIPMAIHLDGVALTQLGGLNMAGADIERIEVLKGPQGVLSGRNSTGGAINIVTVKPDLGVFGFTQQFTVAERGQFLSKTIVNVPVSDTVAAKVAYLHSDRDNLGVSNSAPNGIKFGEKSADSLRLDLRWKAGNSVTVDYGFDHAKTSSYDLPNQCLVPMRGLTSAFGVNIDTAAATDPRLRSYIDGCSPNKLSSLYVPFQMPKNQNTAEGHNLTITWEVDPNMTFRSITGYRKVDTTNNILYNAGAGNANVVRSDSMPITILPVGSTSLNGQGGSWKLYNESYSQEFQLLGNIGKNFKYTTGLYYSSEKGHDSQGPGIFYTVPDLGGPGVDLISIEDKGLTSKNSSWAVFGQVAWRPDILERKLEIVPGVRVTHDHRQAVGFNRRGTGYVVITPGADPNVVMSVAPPVPLGTPYTGAVGDNSYSNTSPSISFDYHWNNDLMTYVKASKGYVTGGFDDQQGSAAGFSKGFSPETITSYELGLKGEFLGRRLRVNGDVFESTYKNEQKTTAGPGGVWAIENVGTSKYHGAELDVTAAVTERFRAGINATWLSHKYVSWIDPVSGLDVASQRKLVVPNLSYSVNLDYRFPDMGLPGRLEGNLNFSHHGSQSTPIDLTSPTADYLKTPAYNLVNGRLALTQIKAGPGNHGDLTVALWGKNLTDRKYGNFNLTNTSADQVTTWSEPRTYGIDVIYRY